ncbi:MAG: redox-sensing transcriptional repressor Rex [Elusimicrobiota bacterium]|nr:redox-sensing transcriptional repressor Rex [Elusimicrobiota bacterium]
MLNKATIERLIIYNRVIKELCSKGEKWVTSTDIAEVLSKTPAQVRKDISSLGPKGKRGVGYNIKSLIGDLDKALGLNAGYNLALVGAGNLGRALIGYPGFKREGFICHLIIDSDPGKIGKKISGIRVESSEKLSEKIKTNKIDIAVIAVPAAAAQGVADKVIEGGIKEILNFAPVTINAPEVVNIRYVDLALELENLAYLLNYRKKR